MWFRRKKRPLRRRSIARRAPRNVEHYQKHKEFAREIISERVAYWNEQYQFAYKRIAIKNQRRCWGSCSEHGNLNFNYKIIFLPEELMDYVIVHELCHIAELNHSKVFWSHVAKAVPDYREKRVHLRKMTGVPASGFLSSAAKTRLMAENR